MNGDIYFWEDIKISMIVVFSILALSTIIYFLTLPISNNINNEKIWRCKKFGEGWTYVEAIYQGFPAHCVNLNGEIKYLK
jgi:hypothetical protein